MNKRKNILIIAVLALILLVGTIIFISVRNSSNENYNGETIIKNNYYKETENSISFDSKKSITETREKIINITPFQKAVITIDKNELSGNLNVEVYEEESSKKINKQKDLLTNNEFVKIEEGLGNYIIKINAEDIIGKYNISIDIQENDITELYTSTKGYELEYDSSKFQIINENGKEKFKFVNDENDIYFMVDVIEGERIEAIKNEIENNSGDMGNCLISESNLSGVYTEEDNVTLKNRKMFFEISEQKIIIIETNNYSETSKNILPSEHIKNMIKTFRLETA